MKDFIDRNCILPDSQNVPDGLFRGLFYLLRAQSKQGTRDDSQAWHMTELYKRHEAKIMLETRD